MQTRFHRTKMKREGVISMALGLMAARVTKYDCLKKGSMDGTNPVVPPLKEGV